MEKQLKIIKENRKVAPSTLDLYKRNMNTIVQTVTGKKFESIDFILSHYDLVLEFLDTLSKSTRRT
jgi:site-specific recombinase XerC